jgi:hypothetical protein
MKNYIIIFYTNKKGEQLRISKSCLILVRSMKTMRACFTRSYSRSNTKRVVQRTLKVRTACFTDVRLLHGYDCDNNESTDVALSNILVDIKCGKCNKAVRNGILCENCDKWFHFNKCSNVREDKISDKYWYCNLCSPRNACLDETMVM